MLLLKRLVVWLSERTLEGFLLGGVFAFLSIRELSAAWVSALLVGVVLFVHGYYFTTAIFGVLWRTKKSWLYGATTATLFALHSHIVFLRAKPDFTPEARAMEAPFVLCGACVVFACSFGGNHILNRWGQTSGNTNPYLSATAVTLLVFALTNIAHFLRPAAYDDSFRPYGLPFHFYREGGFVKEWVWIPDRFIWQGVLADAVLVAGIVLLSGKMWQRLNARTETADDDKLHSDLSR